MIKNNLDGHLRWLLAEKACVPPLPPPIQIGTDVPSPPRPASTSERGSTQAPGESLRLEAGPSRVLEHQLVPIVASSTTLSATPRRLDNAAAIPTTAESQSMARLRTAPTPNAKSLLVSQRSQQLQDVDPAANVQHNVRHGELSHVRAERNQTFWRPEPKSLATPRHHPHHVVKDEVSYSDVFSVDLTSSDRARKAGHEDPCLRKGHKRTSEEFEEDLSQDENLKDARPRTGHGAPQATPPGEYTAIDDILDDVPPPPYSTAPAKAVRAPAAQPSLRMNAHSEGSFRQAGGPEHGFQIAAGVQRPKRKSFTRTDSELKHATPATKLCIRPSPVRSQQKTIVPNHQPSTRRRANVVSDSEDEDDETLWESMSTLSWSKKGDVAQAGLPTEALGPFADQANDAITAELPPALDRIGTTLSKGQAQGDHTQPDSTACHVESGADALNSFMQWPSSHLEEYQTQLMARRRAKAQAAADAVSKQNQALVAQLQNDLRALNPQIAACEALQGRRSELAKSLRRRTELYEQLIETIAIDPDFGPTYTAVNAQHQAIAKAVEHLEQQLLDLLRSSGILTGGGPSLRLVSLSTSQKVAVRSTQAKPTSILASSIMHANEPNALSTQRVQQTQAPAFGASIAESPCKARSEVRFHPERPLQQRYQHDPYRHSDRMSHAQPKSPTKGEKYVDPDDDFDELRSADDGLFETNMGGYVNDFDGGDGDEYGIDDFDDDMANLADAPENPRIPLAGPSRIGSRSIMGNIAGNEMPPPAAAKKGKQPAKLSVPEPASHLMQFRWSADVKKALLQRFKLRGFRSNQLEAINATLGGKDAFVLMPTGGGKSLCYQLPSIVTSGNTRGVTVVISPLLSLMEDQVDHLQKIQVQAFRLNSECTAEEKRFIYRSLSDSKVEDLVQLLYVAPEMINTNQTFLNAIHKLHQRGRLARIVIDEAHCVSQWGHDFRPDYKAIGDIRRQFDGVPAMALTATATENVKADVIHNLGMRNCEVFTQSFNRPNLSYEVRSKGGGTAVLDEIADIIMTKHKGQSGIIYCLSRKTCEQVAEALSKQYNIKAHHYHAQVPTQDKREIQQMWQKGRYSVIVATIAFGMGIDKPDVRYVIHHTVPKSLEGYYQETGRAGRDGLKSSCYLFYGFKDTTILRKMIQDGDGDAEQKKRQHAMLRHVVQFCENKADCRRTQVLAYFNEGFRPQDCNGGCDNCNSSTRYEERDYSDYAKSALDLVEALQEDKVTLHQCVDVFRGANKIKKANWRSLEGYGHGSDLDRGDADRLFFRLISEEALKEVNETNRAGFTTAYLKLAKNNRAFRSGKKKLHIQIRVTPNPKRTTKAAAKSRVAATKAEYPASTNVSSPIQAASRRRKLRARESEDEDEDAFESMHGNGCRDPGFVVSDDAMDEDFAPIREAGMMRMSRRRSPGPPITIDEKLASLSEIHQGIVADFVTQGRALNQKIVMSKSLRASPFSDTILRTMAIDFPRNDKELLKIPDINEEMVRTYGKGFLKLVDQTRRFYEEAMQTREAQRDVDPNHRNVIDLTEDAAEEAAAPEEDSDEDYGEVHFDDDDDDDGTQSPPGERSSYFTPSDMNEAPSFTLPAHVAASQAQWMAIVEAGSRTRAEREASHAASQSYKHSRGNGEARRGRRGSFKNSAPRKRTSSSSYKRDSGVMKSRTSGGAKRSTTTGLTSGGGRNGGGGAFGMMPTT